MIRALYTARTGMNGQQTQLDVISNNLANVNTGGFKKSRSQFEDLFYQSLRSVGAETVDGGMVPTGVQVGLGTKVTSVQKIFTQGNFTETGNDLDVAIEGDGFFQIIREGVTYYTRDGSFNATPMALSSTPMATACNRSLPSRPAPPPSISTRAVCWWPRTKTNRPWARCSSP